MIPTLSNSVQTTVIFLDVILRNDKMSSSTAINNLKMLNEKFINMFETESSMLVVPETLEYFTEVSNGSRIFTPLLSMVRPNVWALISISSFFMITLHQKKKDRRKDDKTMNNRCAKTSSSFKQRIICLISALTVISRRSHWPAISIQLSMQKFVGE